MLHEVILDAFNKFERSLPQTVEWIDRAAKNDKVQAIALFALIGLMCSIADPYAKALAARVRKFDRLYGGA